MINTQVKWRKIREELHRLADVDTLKSEVHRIGTELKKFDLNRVLSPRAQERVKTFEKRYAVVVEKIGRAQEQVDREVGKLMKQIHGHREEVTKVVTQQKHKLEEISRTLKTRFTRGADEVKTTATANAAAPQRKKKKKTSGTAAAEGVARRTKRPAKSTRRSREI